MLTPAFLVTAPVLSSAFVHRAACTSRRRRYAPARYLPRMSGVNGGIDYDIDLSSLPPSLAARVAYIQRGPDSPTELIAAAEEIAAAASAHPQTLPVLVDMLGFNNPVAANIAVSALADAGDAAIAPLLTGVAAFNYAVNAYALRALARIGDPAVADVCIACARRGPIPNVRRAACRALAALHFQSTDTARDAFSCLVKLADAELDWGVRYAAIVALEKFEALHVIDPEVVRDAVDVVRATSEGRSRISRFVPYGAEETDGKGESTVIVDDIVVDPAVRARAVVALETLAPRVDMQFAV